MPPPPGRPAGGGKPLLERVKRCRGWGRKRPGTARLGKEERPGSRGQMEREEQPERGKWRAQARKARGK
jgi:hypothetical protein